MKKLWIKCCEYILVHMRNHIYSIYNTGAFMNCEQPFSVLPLFPPKVELETTTILKKTIKKQHHHTPIAYLKFFCNERRKILVYRKDKPNEPFFQSPRDTGSRKHYYAQPIAGGGQDHNTLEDTFSTIEDKWPPIVEKLLRRENVNDSLSYIFEFILLQTVRVPRTRDAIENILVESIKKKKIFNSFNIAIDPHMSIHAMPGVAEEIGEKVLANIGFSVMHNTTKFPFLTSDNPVIYFDSSEADIIMQPYAIHAGGPIVFLFPVTPSLLIYGNSEMFEQFSSFGLEHWNLSDSNYIETINSQICRFAYEFIYAKDNTHEALICKHADISPIMKINGDGKLNYVFGKRTQKEKWF